MAMERAALRILIVEDNPDDHLVYRRYLDSDPAREYAVATAESGAAGLAEFAANPPDCILLDFNLPDMDGLDVCKRIRTLGLHVPVIFLTVRATVEDLEHGLAVAGPGSDYVRKLDELRRMQVDGEGFGDVQVALKAPDTHELIARIRARLPVDVQELDPSLRIDRKRRAIERKAGEAWKETALRPLEYEVFKTLVDGDGPPCAQVKGQPVTDLSGSSW